MAISATINGNAPGEIKGIELVVTIAPGGGLTLNASYAYTDAKFLPQTHLLRATPTLVSVNAAFTPRHAGSIAVDYRFPLRGRRFRMR